MENFAGIAFEPLLPVEVLIALALVAFAVSALAVLRRAGGVWWRVIAMACGLLALANPAIVQEDRSVLPDVAVVVIDDSPSMGIGERRQQAAEAEAALKDKLKALPNLETHIVHAGGQAASGGPNDDGTRLFEALDHALADTPRERFAGAILVTDGQVHDAPPKETAAKIGGPVHTLLVGKPGEIDRRLVIERAPRYGIVGDPLSLSVRVEEAGADGKLAPVTLTIQGHPPQTVMVPVGASHEIPFVLDHGGPTFIEISVEPGQHELTLQNNRAAVMVNGVRDRLRVLLISGEPHAGERVWRNLLKADPSVDLVHFTILRPPEKQDGTPIRELSLIAFPIRELFEVKLPQFDLIIFDRYRRGGILPQQYFQNIADYVQNGGALLEASSPDFGTPFSLYRTPLAAVLPGRPTGVVFTEGFTPLLSDAGRRHPVTADLPGARAKQPAWGRWFRQVEVEPTHGDALMTGVGGHPLMLLDRVGKGRVAQIFSDHTWLWARGFEGGGPEAELLRRLAHWMMKEPELEEDALSASSAGDRLDIVRQSMKPDATPVTVTTPSGATQQVTLKDSDGGHATGSVPVREPGLYRLSDGTRSAIAAVGAINPKEFADVRATDALLTPVAQASKGAVRWLVDGMPEIRSVAPDRDRAGRTWLGLVAHRDYLVNGVQQVPLMPAILVLILVIGGLALAWHREGR
ncbi:MAG TPA: hypothetical protein VEU47_13690 [Candidatus Cybelea sp.]|nr:hypothetical protein [Candidatus Cybelea sp.]